MSTKETSLRIVVRNGRESVQMADPGDALMMAEKMSDKPALILASDYAPAVDVLRHKGYTWIEIKEWLSSIGADYSSPAIVSAWRKWKSRQALAQVAP